MREHLTIEELIRAMSMLLSRGHDLRIEMWSYRVQAGGNDGEWRRPKEEWTGGVAHEIRVRLALHDTYIPASDVDALLADIRACGFVAYFASGEDSLIIAVGTPEQSRVITSLPLLEPAPAPDAVARIVPK
jgi:hypothetical protein